MVRGYCAVFMAACAVMGLSLADYHLHDAWKANIEAQQEALETRQDAADKRRQTSITCAEAYQEQGRSYLQDAAELQLDDLLVPLNPEHARQHAAITAGPLQAARRGSGVQTVQEMMMQMAMDILALTRLPGREYFDTSQTGLSILPPGRCAKPDLAGCEGEACASNVSIISEAKPSLDSHTDDCEAAYQVVQRALQLSGQQSQRTKWVFASVGCDSIRIFKIHTAHKYVKSLAVTLTLPLSASAASSGLTALLRLHSTPADRLGWLPHTAFLPGDLQLDGEPVQEMHTNTLSESATLADFLTLWPQEGHDAKLTFSIQYVAMARLADGHTPPTLETELESVMYWPQETSSTGSMQTPT
ncbi:hypothetical protein WJX74_008424 [Apatococcus lobatus]|uniref:Uncharacterized protein n=1 Tax=Apatococcus lobatus TaxID=904363 RepID=A0AAW1QBT2_9CHLO